MEERWPEYISSKWNSGYIKLDVPHNDYLFVNKRTWREDEEFVSEESLVRLDCHMEKSDYESPSDDDVINSPFSTYAFVDKKIYGFNESDNAETSDETN